MTVNLNALSTSIALIDRGDDGACTHHNSRSFFDGLRQDITGAAVVNNTNQISDLVSSVCPIIDVGMQDLTRRFSLGANKGTHTARISVAAHSVFYIFLI